MGATPSPASWVSASNFTDNEVARPNVDVPVATPRAESGGNAIGVRELAPARASRARADIKFAKFRDVDSGHARGNVSRGNFAARGK